jgi:putative cell wall-binding protein
MEKGLEAYKVVRLAGSNRFGTNLEILKQAGIYRNAPILVATGSNFADSLSASAVGAPILLVHKKLTNEQKDFLTKKADVNKNSIYILGGESAVNAAIEAEFKAMGFQVKRLAGKNRFDTSVLIAEEFFGEPTSAVLAYAANYPDGLCGGALANIMGAPLILTMDKQASVAAEYVKKAGIERAVSLGGEGLISDAAVKTILGK